MIKDISNTNKDETYEKESNPKISFYVNPQIYEILLKESKNEGHNFIGQYCKNIVLQRHKNQNRNTDDF
jgi:hypothetical protein